MARNRLPSSESVQPRQHKGTNSIAKLLPHQEFAHQGFTAVSCCVTLCPHPFQS